MSFALQIDNLELHNFSRNLRQFPQFIRPATASLLNKICFQIRTESLKVIQETMTVRNVRFVAGRLRYQKALPQAPVGRQFGLVGSWADRPRFGGWQRQVGQAEPPRNKGKRTIMLAARGGDESAQVKPAFRVKPGREFLSWKNVHFGKPKTSFSPKQRQAILLRMVFAEKYSKPFILGSPKPPGLYRRVGNRIEMLQSFRKDKQKVRKTNWMLQAIKRGLGHIDMDKEWYNCVRYAMSKVKVR